MPVTQQQPIFDANEAPRFAALWAGFDIGNPSDAEAMGKGRAVRRMVAGKTFYDGTPLRLVDALDLPEIRQALDDQMELHPRTPDEDVAALKTENEDLRSKLAAVVPEVTFLAEALARETELRIRVQGRQNGSLTGPVLSGVLALALAVECVLAVIGLFGGRATPRPEPAGAAMVAATVTPAITPAEETKSATKQEYRPDTRPKAKAKPVRVVVVPEVEVPLQGVPVVVKPESSF